MCVNTQFYAVNGMTTISTANANLNGSGVLGTVYTVGAFSGAVVSSVIIKAIGATTLGMVRLFVNDGSSTFLWREIEVEAINPNVQVQSFEAVINEELFLDTGYTLYASTQNAESFNIVANVNNWTNCNCSNICSCSDMQIFGNTGMVQIATANANLDGTGALGTVLTSPSANPLSYGTFIVAANIKAIETTSIGMVRLFLNDGISATNYLIKEVNIPSCLVTNIEPAYRANVFLGFALAPGAILKASTQIAEHFNVVLNVNDWVNCPCPQNP
jgi:hypothetical protein